MITNKQKQLQMWYKVQELTEKGLNKSQIREATGLDRATIRKYQQIDETRFHTMPHGKRPCDLLMLSRPSSGRIRDLHPIDNFRHK